MNVAILAVATLSLAASATTLVVMLVGAKKAEQKVEEMKVKTNASLTKLKSAIADLEV